MTTITEALRAARACIQQDRTSLADTGMRHDNTMEPDAAAGVAEYDAVLQQIDAALAGMTHHITDEQIDELCLSLTGTYTRKERDRAVARAVLALAAPAPAVPSIDYMALIDAARVRHKYAQGTRACVAFKHGAEWFREQALTAAPTPPAQSEPKTADDDFLLGVCVALQTVTSMDCGVTWRQIVESVGVDDILYYAAWIEPEEWELAGFARYARRELRRGQPPKGRPPLRFAQPTPTAQPAVPEDVARDAGRYRWLRDMASQDWLHRNHNYQNLRGAAFDAAIDAARAAEKGGE